MNIPVLVHEDLSVSDSHNMLTCINTQTVPPQATYILQRNNSTAYIGIPEESVTKQKLQPQVTFYFCFSFQD
jgi:hypothetical protein